MRNKYDRFVKLFVDTFPRLLLHICDVLAVTVNATVEPLDRERAGAVIPVDHMLRVTIGRRVRHIHFEFVTHYRSNVRRQMARIGLVVGSDPKRPVDSVIVLLNRKGAPRRIPTTGEFRNGGLRAT